MEVHQLRVVNERFDLNEKIEKLTNFFDTETYQGLDHSEQRRLIKQQGIMIEYRDVLDSRIEAF